MSGNDAASVGSRRSAAKYDAFVIVSSSYGDGDPPSNFENFLRALYTADEGVLAGKQHCVLGYGSTDYETFELPAPDGQTHGRPGVEAHARARRSLHESRYAGGRSERGTSPSGRRASSPPSARFGKSDVCFHWTVPERMLARVEVDKKSGRVGSSGGVVTGRAARRAGVVRGRAADQILDKKSDLVGSWAACVDSRPLRCLPRRRRAGKAFRAYCTVYLLRRFEDTK